MRYPNNVDLEVGYARGLFLKDSRAEYRRSVRALELIRKRHRRFGREGIYNFNGIVDNCEVVDDLLEQKVMTDRYISEALLYEELDHLSREHLGGDGGFRCLAFNRGSAANITVMAALVKANATVVSLVPPRGGHPSISRGIALAHAHCAVVGSAEEIERVINTEDVSLIVICPLYRDQLDYDVLQRSLTVANSNAVPVYVDDAGGARLRTAFLGQAKVIDLGADIVMTCTDKEGLNGPRASVVRGRTDLIEIIGTKSAEIGTEARPSVLAAIVRALREYDPATYKISSLQHNERARRIGTKVGEYLERVVRHGTHGGDIALDAEMFLEAIMEKAKVKDTRLSPVDASVAHAMIMLEDFGFMTVASTGKPGSTLDFRVRLNLPDAKRISDELIVRGITVSCDKLIHMINDFDRIERYLFGVVNGVDRQA